MKQTLLVVVASAAIGAAAALYFSAPAPSARPAPQLDARTLETAVRRALESVGFGAQARAPQAPPAGPLPRDGDLASPPGRAIESAAAAAPEARRDGDPLLPPADRQAIGSLRGFDGDETLRRTWLFRGERDVIAWLGAPDEVHLEAGGERWIYNKPDGMPVVAYFARGRLVNMFE